MHRVWIVHHYVGQRALAYQVFTGTAEPLLGDVIDGPAWLVRLLIGDPVDAQPKQVRDRAHG